MRVNIKVIERILNKCGMKLEYSIEMPILNGLAIVYKKKRFHLSHVDEALEQIWMLYHDDKDIILLYKKDVP